MSAANVGASAGSNSKTKNSDYFFSKLSKDFKPENNSGPKIIKLFGIPKKIVSLEDVDREFAVLIPPGSPSAYISRSDFQPITDTDLRRRLEDSVVQDGEANGVPTYTSAAKFWCGHAGRHVYRNLAFTNKHLHADTLNLFRGLGVKPKAGNCDKILKHIFEVLCAGNEKDADAFVKLVAWQIQNIGKPSRIITVLRSSQQQIGKGVFLEMLAKIYGPSGFIAAQIDQVLGRFNTAIRGCAYVFLDEVLFSGDRKAADAIKSLSTQSLIGIEAKGLPIVQCPIALNFWLASNHENAAHIEEHDARYWVLNCDPKYFGNSEYFAALIEEIENGGAEAFAHYLLSLEVSDFTPSRDVPIDNEAKRSMVRLSLNPWDARKWLEDCAHTSRIIGMRQASEFIDPTEATWQETSQNNSGWTRWREGDKFDFADLVAAYVEWQKTVKGPIAAKPTPPGNLGEVLSSAGFTRKQIRSGGRVCWFSILPSVEVCLAALHHENMSRPSQPSQPYNEGGV